MDIKALMENVDKSPLYGNNGYGKEFDDMTECAEKGLPFPVGIIVRQGDIVDQVCFVYDDFTSKHGGEGGAANSFDLQPDEKIVKVSGCLARYGNDRLLKTIEFTTDKGRVFSTGSPAGGEAPFEYVAKEGYSICALHGRSAQYVGGIGFCARKNDLDLGGSFKGFGGKFGDMMK